MHNMIISYISRPCSSHSHASCPGCYGDWLLILRHCGKAGRPGIQGGHLPWWKPRSQDIHVVNIAALFVVYSLSLSTWRSLSMLLSSTCGGVCLHRLTSFVCPVVAPWWMIDLPGKASSWHCNRPCVSREIRPDPGSRVGFCVLHAPIEILSNATRHRLTLIEFFLKPVK